ncbi:hypothetical protein Rhopal_002163-T1 [Rhodotorula paludigena]|uniref:RNI-like protein n=1 Tax=Rhodotorula paludigena TaxID=86838 RepID=A0AAV5GIN6_9BASI|nr:hypothetical protein Rhopal_002163-T1 [Rhodotorula paludigena]
MDFSRFRSPALDLADFLRSLAVPRAQYGASSYGSSRSRQEDEWEILRARQGGTKRLDFFDHNAAGPEGAVLVLRAMEKSPGVTELALSHNPLGDDGIREFLSGMKRLRSRDIGAHLERVNLSDCDLSDVSLHLITLHLLRPSPHPPSLQSLYLNNNGLSLGSQSSLSSLPDFLGNTLSSSSCSLRCLDLTSNRNIGTRGLLSLLEHLNLAAGPSHLSELRLSMVGLTPDCAEPLAAWLEDPILGGRLLILTVNANALGQAGVRRLARTAISGRASSLLHLECLANDEGDDEQWASVNTELEQAAGEETLEDWRDRLRDALRRNQQVYRETRLAALRLVAPARILFGGNACEPESAPISDAAEAQHAFPFLRLPIELQVHVLRCLMLLAPSSAAHLYPSLASSTAAITVPASTSSATRTLSAPLTEPQFLRILAHSASRATLATEQRIAAAHAAGEAPSLIAQSGGNSWRGERDEVDMGNGWEEWYLRAVGCDRFERAAPL